jgi:multicomponent Na+:H+ antiporter subunit D
MLLGVFSALLQSDIKKILAYHTVSQIGFILLGISFMSDIGEAGGLLHLVNHALFKALLFLCAGAIIYSTGTRNLHELGGLAKHLPITAAACLVGSLAISGIPPFNGYVSKCILFEASPPGYVSVLFSITCAGTVASFIKLFWHAFFGASGKKPPRRTIPLSMKVSLIVLSSLCVFTGVFAHHILAFTGYTVEIHASNISHLWQIGLNIGLGIAMYGIGMKTGFILNPPQIRITIDRFYHMSGRTIEYLGTVIHDILLQDINYYALSIFFVLIAIYILFSL